MKHIVKHIEMKHCTHCQATEDLIKYSKQKFGQYYLCNPCNTARIQEYRKKLRADPERYKKWLEKKKVYNREYRKKLKLHEKRN